MNRRLYRSRDDRMLAGVAGGLAELWDADPSLVRVVWAVLVPFTGGIALLVYVVMALVVPEDDESSAFGQSAGFTSTGPDPAATGATTDDAAAGAGATTGTPTGAPRDWHAAEREARAARRAARRARRSGPSNGGVLIGVLLVIAGVYFLVREYIPEIDVNWLWPAALVVLGVVVLGAALRRPPDDTADPGGPR